MPRPRRSLFFSVTAHSLALAAIAICGPNIFAAAADADIPQIRAAAERGSVHEQMTLADAYLAGRGVQQDLKLAAYWYEKAAGYGDPLAQNQIGYFYQLGIGVPMDTKRAAHWFQLAASSGYTSAKVNLGIAYMWGKGVSKNPRIAEQLIREAADKGNATALAYLGDMYYFGVGVPQDKTAGEQWYEKGAKLHDSLAEYRLGVIHSEPTDHARDMRRSATLFRESASAGYVPAMHSLAVILVNHPELSAEPGEVISLLSQAEIAGTWKSSVVLGILSRDGKLVPKDDERAYFHFQVARLQGGDAAKDLLHNDLLVLGTKLNNDEKSKIDKEATAWTATHNVHLQTIYKRSEKADRFPAFALGFTPAEVHAAALIPTNADMWNQSVGARSAGLKEY